MTEEPTADEGGGEPTAAEMEAWLETPEGSAAMREVMEKVVRGEFGEVAPELLGQAQAQLRLSHSHKVMGVVRRRFDQLLKTMLPTGPLLSASKRWGHVNGLYVEMKALMDLMLEVHEPHRSKLMRQMLPVQQQLEELLKNL